MKKPIRFAIAPLLAIIIGCSGEPSSENSTVARSDVGRPATSQADRSIWSLGNSHSSVGDPFGQLQRLIEAEPDRPTVEMQTFSGPFLDSFAPRVDAWSESTSPLPEIVVLQGQKISMSGQFDHPRDTAVDLTIAFAGRGARVLLFAEWARHDVDGERERIEKVYRQIRDEAIERRPELAERIDVVPIGRVWERVLATHPDVRLHDADGNHSNRIGAAVTAVTLHAWLFDHEPSALPIGLTDDPFSRDLRRMALETCREVRFESAVDGRSDR